MSFSTDDPEDAARRTGTVLRKTIGHYGVLAEGRTIVCTLSSRLRKQLIYPTADPGSRHHRVEAVLDVPVVDPVAVGDRVEFMPAPEDTGMIVAVLPRRNKLTRRAAGAKPLEQVIAANVDQVVAVMSAARPAPKWELLDRYLAAAEAVGMPAVACITKIDLAGAHEFEAELDNYRGIGYPVLLNSATTGAGIDEVRAALRGRVSVLVGKSGVGKTTLLNALEPGLGLRVNAVSDATDKGRHTTTHLEMFMLEMGGSIVDTPGMREFGLWDVSADELAGAFPEMRPFLGRCRFGASCAHDGEPGCAIRGAVAAGHITERRYRSYLRMQV